jgi:hypothetical protein
MDLASILLQIDAEISKLQRIREIVQTLAGSRVSVRRPRRSKAIAPVSPPSASAPELVILPPKQKREYRPRLKPAPTAPRALGPAPSQKPVFVPRASVATPVEQNHAQPEIRSLEALVRHNLLGGVA